MSGLIKNATSRRKRALLDEGIKSPSAKKKLALMFDVIMSAHESLKGKGKENKQRRKFFVQSISAQTKKIWIAKFDVQSSGDSKEVFDSGMYGRDQEKEGLCE